MEEPTGQRAHCSPLKLIRHIPKGLQARARAGRCFGCELAPLTEGAAGGEVQGEVSHGQQDPHPAPHTAAWPQGGLTAGRKEMRLNVSGQDLVLLKNLTETQFNFDFSFGTNPLRLNRNSQ